MSSTNISQSPPTLIPEQHASFARDGYLVLRDVLSPTETTTLQSWAQQVHDLPRTESAPWMPYDEINARGHRVLCRTENFASSHPGFDALLRGPKFLGIVDQLAQEPMCLFKEKINYKLAGSGGYAPHIDSTAYTHVKNVKHLTILLAVDATSMRNGGLEVVEGSHAMSVPIAPSDKCIEPKWVAEQTWRPVDLAAGELLVFGSYLAHRSGANTSGQDRRTVYATYNCKSEGDLHDAYYADRAKEWPATHMRKAGERYEKGSLRYGAGSPMLSVEMGRQLEV